MNTPHELRRRLAHGLRLGSAGVVAAVGGRAAVGNARPLVLGTVLGEAPAPTGRGTASGRGHDQCADADPVTILGPADGPWTDALRALPLAERMPCTPLVLGAELRTATARRDPARVRDLVAWAAVHDWAHLPSVRQGAALLARVARATAQRASLAS